MPNLISVTRTGPDIFSPVKEVMAHPTARQVVGETRKAGAILKANPVGALISDLIFTPSMADGTMDARSKIY